MTDTLERFASRLAFRVSVLTQQAIIAGVAERWKEQYYGPDGWRDTISGSAKPVYDNLIALDSATATVKDIEAVIGNASWTRADCQTCREPEFPVVLFERFGEYDSEALEERICCRCIDAAAEVLRVHRASTGTTPTGQRARNPE